MYTHALDWSSMPVVMLCTRWSFAMRQRRVSSGGSNLSHGERTWRPQTLSRNNGPAGTRMQWVTYLQRWTFSRRWSPKHVQSYVNVYRYIHYVNSFQYLWYISFNFRIRSRWQLVFKKAHHKPIDLLQDVFVNQLTILVKKRQMIEVNVEEGWYSEQELKQDLKWSTY